MFHPWTISTLRTSLECKCPIQNTFSSKHILHMILTITCSNNNTAHENLTLSLLD